MKKNNMSGYSFSMRFLAWAFYSVLLSLPLGSFAQTYSLYLPAGPSDIGISSTGNVGIGTAAPLNKLHVWGPSGDSETGIVRIDSDGENASLRIGIHDDYAWIQSHGEKPLYLNDAGNNTVINRQDGNVGVGVANPSNKLHVWGVTGDSDTGILRLDGDAANASMRFGINTDYAWIQSHGGKPLYLNELGNNTIINKQDGNVGIGTTSPDAKLAVKGDIHAQEVRVDLNVAGPDYVFEKDYNLPTLEQIKSYIDEHKHLPEVPSAKEMEENGINVGEMNMILLKKVEELTLHLINQSKQLGDQQEIVRAQQQTISSQNERIEKLEKALKNN